MRVRLDATRTVVPDDQLQFAVVNDGWHLISGTCRYNSVTDTSLLDMGVVYPDGRYKNIPSGLGNLAGSYNPRSTTSEAMWATAEVNDNTFEGSILAVYFFRGAILDEKELRDLYANPWQVFAPQRILMPMTAAAPVVEEEAGEANTAQLPSGVITLTPYDPLARASETRLRYRRQVGFV